MRRKNGRLTLKAMNRTIDQGFFEKKRCIVRQEARGKIVRAIDDHIVACGNRHRLIGSESHAMKINFHMGIDLAQPRSRAVEFGFSDPRLAVQDLTMEVGNIDHIGVDQTNPTDTGSSEIERRRRTQGTRTHQQHRGIFQTRLTLDPDFWDHQLTRITRQFGRG